ENKAFRDTHPDYFYAYSRTPKARYASIRKSARQRGITFDLTLEQFEAITARWCVYSIQIESGIRTGADRKDNTRGYSGDNCQPCCYWHNHVKADVFTHEQMLDLVQRYSIRCGNAPGRRN